MTTHNQSQGEQPGTENDGADVGAQPQNAVKDMESYSADELLAAITGNATSDPQETEPASPQGAQPENEDGQNTDDHPQGKGEAIRLRLSALPPEKQQEAADAYRLVREGKATDLLEALQQLRGQSGTETATPDDAPAATPEAETKSGPVSELERQIADARAQLKEARDIFDLDKEDELETEIQNLVRKHAKEELKAELEAEKANNAQTEFQREYSAAVNELEETYPDVLDDDSQFTQLLDDKLAAARHRKDARLSNPRFILDLASEVATILNKPSGRKPSPPPAISRPNGASVATGHNQVPRPSESQMRAALDLASPDELLAAITNGH